MSHINMFKTWKRFKLKTPTKVSLEAISVAMWPFRDCNQAIKVFYDVFV